jgi:1-deoxy-D-xylulose-5-phosphate reductoisomerase
MGAKITIDSASLMNKGLEVIEAKWLFGVPASKIEVVVHPQSIIHSAVQFEDSSILAQVGIPSMKVPIQYALTYPERPKSNFKRFSFFDYPALTFEKPDLNTFKNLRLAFDVIETGGNFACVLNAANEITNKAFLDGKISFLEIGDINEKTLEKTEFISNPTLEDYIETNKLARQIATNFCN